MASTKNRASIAGTAFFLFCLSLFLTAYSARNPWTTTIGASAGSVFLRPFEVGFDGASSGVSGMWHDYFALMGVRTENVSLKERLSTLEEQNSKYMELESENSRLRNLLGIVQESNLKGVASRVIGHDPSNWTEVLTIDVGREDGVQAGMPVLDGSGVVGQVVGVGGSSSRVLLLTDHASGIDAIVQGSRTRGVIAGDGDTCDLAYVLSDEEVKVGDRVITSGMDGAFPKGMLLGVVSDVEQSNKKSDGMFLNITVKPSVNLSKLEDVFVVTEGNIGKEGLLSESKKIQPPSKATKANKK